MYSNTANVVAMLTCDSEQTTEADYEALAFHLGDRMNNLEDMQVAFNVPEETGNMILDDDGVISVFEPNGEQGGKVLYELGSMQGLMRWDDTWLPEQWHINFFDGRTYRFFAADEVDTPDQVSLWYDGIIGTGTEQPTTATVTAETIPATDTRAISGLRLQYIDEFQTDQEQENTQWRFGVGVSLIVDEVAS
jgi:hypothetical protein